jgi:hypothetical protein
VPELVCTVVAHDGRKTIKDRRTRARDGRSGICRQRAGGRIGREVERLCKDDARSVFGRVSAVRERAVEVERKDSGWLRGWLVRVGKRGRTSKRTRAIIACFVDARLKTRVTFTPLMSSSIRPSLSADSTRAASLRASLRFFFRLLLGCRSAASRSTSAFSRASVADIEQRRQMQSVSTSIFVYSSRHSSSRHVDCSDVSKACQQLIEDSRTHCTWQG